VIPKHQILERAKEWNLRAEIVEKDYVLGWLLAAIGAHPELGRMWIFKGGTCLKKCYFETYRFSEDLGFLAPSCGVVHPGRSIASGTLGRNSRA
jgi:predicted nucleotidyltransferase component of viral defense system